jgi:hypothetical protein
MGWQKLPRNTQHKNKDRDFIRYHGKVKLRDIIAPEHKAAAQALGHALTYGTVDAWDRYMCVIASRLTDCERVASAFSAIRVLNPEDIGPTLEAVIPSPPMHEMMQAAECWALTASQAERDAYMLAGFNYSQAPRQVAFLAYVQRGDSS